MITVGMGKQVVQSVRLMQLGDPFGLLF